MLNIYIPEFLDPPSSMPFIEDVEEGFTRIIGGLEDTEINRKLISEIDHGTYFDNQHFTDRFNCKQPIDYLSTGCKAALCTMSLTDCVVSTVECGRNAINAILQNCNDGNITLPFNYSGIYTLNTPEVDIAVGHYRFTSLQRLYKYMTDEFPDEPDLSTGGISCLK